MENSVPVCKRCGTTEAEAEFYSSIHTHCKECWKVKVKENRIARLDYYKERDRMRANRPDRVAARAAYKATPKGKERLAVGGLAWAKRNPDKRKAQIAIGNALRDGKLIRMPCEICNDSKTAAHHDDYSKPLDVRWLCTKHHAEYHKTFRESKRMKVVPIT
jgi:hypothetical protein